MSSGYHIPVMLHECIDALAIKPAGTYVDATFGGGGHARELMRRLGREGRLYAFDHDPDALRNAINDDRFVLIHQNFRFLKNNLRFHGVVAVDGILASGINNEMLLKAPIDNKPIPLSIRHLPF